MCESVQRLATCRYFRDVTWTLTSFPDNRTTQTVHCMCPRDSVAYIFKHEAFESDDRGVGYKYMFACSPESVSSTRKRETRTDERHDSDFAVSARSRVACSQSGRDPR